ncbi:hypothetical protein DXG01_008955 [Tephrocybe rancida]|nr:hypothetical protein DXG01_008955 [Tephrocybe rancida]
MQFTASFVFTVLLALRPVVCLTTGNSSLIARAAAAHDVSYTGTSGPLGWTRKTENRLCSQGTNQSPIVIDSTSTTHNSASVTLIIPDTTSTFTDTGHSLRVAMEGKGGKLTLGSDGYELLQFHFHTPSEHRIDNMFFPLEMHMVFKKANEDGPKLVIGVLFEVSASSKTDLLATLATTMPTSQTTPATTKNLAFQPIIKHITGQGLYRYAGSLTTPPCAEGITWLVSRLPLDVDVATFNTFKKVIKFNSRYTQNTPGQQNLISFARDNYPPTA